MKSEELLFAKVLALPMAERTVFLRQACDGDAGLQERVEALLRGYDGAGAGLEHPPLEIPAASVQTMLADELLDYTPGTWIGRYRLLQKIGTGGCGIIFMAEQLVPVRRRVAVKIIKLGMDTKEVIARFEAERQALALMDHPNIAHVFDAGATERGRPYFVMELVRGIPITTHCDEHKLGADERLRLFIQICQAVQHAHQKGIIHRDLKPSNILVTMHDGVAVPKIIDFGIAKAMHGRLTDRTLFTAFEQFIGTPAYMSPEQTEMSGLDVDTRSDIYSLGVLLYELLAGRTPFVGQDLLKVGLEEMRRIIRSEEPPKPSTCLVTLSAADRETVARQRGTDVPQLNTLLRGDLDWIVMRAIEKDRTRRYETASSLAADIERHLRNEPVVARPPSPAYLLQRLVRRHKLAFAAIAGIAAALGLGLVFAMWGLQREHTARLLADTESARSAQVARFMRDMLAGVGPQMALERDTKMLRAILDETVERLPRELRGQPEVEASLRETLGNVYRDLGQLRSAALMHETALQLRQETFGAEHPATADSIHQLGEVFARQGRLAEAETLLRRVLEVRIKLLGPENSAVTETRAALENVLLRQRQQADEALEADALPLPAPPRAEGSDEVSHFPAPGTKRSALPPARAQPVVIRFAHSGGRSAGRTFNSGNILRTAQMQGALEREFSAEGIRIEWTTLPSGPATNDVFFRQAIDFASQGDAGAISGRAAGLNHRLLLALTNNPNGSAHLVVRADSPFHSLADLKGRRLATIKQTSHHLTMCHLLEKNGLSEKDFDILDLGSGAAVVSSVVAGESDATLMNLPFDLVKEGKLRVIYDTDHDPDSAGVSVFWVSVAFADRHPAIVQRVMNALVKTAAWSSDERNRRVVFELWSKPDWSLEAVEKSWAGLTLKEQLSPLMDDCFLTRLRRRTVEARRFGLIDTDVKMDGWTEPKYLNQALKELKLERYWLERDAEGNPKRAP